MDVDVLLDLMIHDIDIALEVANSPVTGVHAQVVRSFRKRPTLPMHVPGVRKSRDCNHLDWEMLAKKVRTTTVRTRRHYMVADTLSRSLSVYTADELPAMTDGVMPYGQHSDGNL